MAIYTDKITTLFRECKILEEKYEKKLPIRIKTERPDFDNKKSRKVECNNFPNRKDILAINSRNQDSPQVLSNDIDRILSGTNIQPASVEYSSLSKMMAMSHLAAGNEITAIGYLIESHAVILKQHIYHRFTKTLIRKEYGKQSNDSGLNPVHTKFHPKLTKNDKTLRETLARMPREIYVPRTEWYMVQITAAYKEPHSSRGNDSVLDSTLPLHITVLPTGEEDGAEPFCVTVPRANYDANHPYDGLEEIVKIQKNNKADLEAFYANNRAYWKMRENQNNRMKTAVKELEYSWLREWRILLMADPLEDSNLVKDLRSMIDKLIADDLSAVDVSNRTRWLLKKIATSSCFLSKIEIARAVNHVLRGNDKLANNVVLSIHGKMNIVNELRMEKRKTLVMIVDECLDHIPFESMDVLKYHPATRFPSFHIAHAMFKEHESTIVKGCKIIKNVDKLGTFIINPARNLDKMEKRMRLFLDYWLPKWKGHYGVEPDPELFGNVLVNSDVLLYSGHGSGIQYVSGESIERLRVRATVLLFGCSSVKLWSTGGRFPPYGVSNQYLIACSPCVLGMLWEVTDGDIDKMTARFMSDWIPSDPKKSWSNVDVNTWCDGVLKFKTPLTDSGSKSGSEPELLRAVATSKDVCTQHMTSAAIIVRGLPIRRE